MKHIGILAHSAEGAVLCYRTAVLAGIDRLGPHHHPHITMTGTSMHESMEAWEQSDYVSIRRILVGDAARLAAAGADFFVLPDNTAHIALELPGEELPLPGIHIASVVADAAQAANFAKVAILGTLWTMEGSVYPNALSRKGIAHAIPGAEDRHLIQRIIFEELCLGKFGQPAREAFSRIIDDLAANGCDAVALVCTEIPILLGQKDSSLPILDSTRLLAQRAVAVALGDAPFPDWKGGPPV